MKVRRILLGIQGAAVLCLCLTNAWGQNSPNEIRQALESSLNKIVRVRTAGGGEFQGELVSVAEEHIKIEDREGLILEIAIDKVTTVVVIDTARGQDTYFQDGAANRLIVMPTGFGMDPGEIHVADQEIAIVSVAYGVSDSFSLWGATSIPGALINARFSADVADNIGISGGAFFGVIFETGATVALPYTIASFGSVNQNFTIGLGAPFYAETVVDFDLMVTGGIATLAGKIVVAPTACIITENWIAVLTERRGNEWEVLGVYIFPAVALRIAGSRFSWDIGVTMPGMYARSYDDEEERYTSIKWDWFLGAPIPLPILGFTYRIQ